MDILIVLSILSILLKILDFFLRKKIYFAKRKIFDDMEAFINKKYDYIKFFGNYSGIKF